MFQKSSILLFFGIFCSILLLISFLSSPVVAVQMSGESVNTQSGKQHVQSTGDNQGLDDTYLSSLPTMDVDHSPGDPLPPITTEMIVVFLITLTALVLFSTEVIPMDLTAILIMVSLILLEPWTGISPQEGISGFASVATVTVMALFVISEGIRRSGVIQKAGELLITYTQGSLRAQLATIITLVCPASGIMNNTAVVAILYPTVSDMAHKSNHSPSKLLIPLSYASMMGGMLTLIGTSTNLLASDLSHRLLGRPIGMFEFTLLGAILSLAGGLFLVLFGVAMLPARIAPNSDLTERFDMKNYLTELTLGEDSDLIGNTILESDALVEEDLDIIRLIRNGKTYLEGIEHKTLREGDRLTLRSDQSTLVRLADRPGVNLLSDITVNQEELEQAEAGRNVVEIVLSPESNYVDETLESLNFRDRYDANVLAIRHSGSVRHTEFEKTPLKVGDVLLIQATMKSVDRLKDDSNFIVAETSATQYRPSKIIPALTITTGVVGLAATGVLSILAAALTGALMMVLSGCLKPRELYRSIQWDVIFLIAGVIPLGIAMEKSGVADLIAAGLVSLSEYLPTIGMLALVYCSTVLLTNVLSNNASVLVMIPVAIDTAMRLNTDPFSFVLAVTFASSMAFMTPMGYQTNLFVYGPGGYSFWDYVKLGGVLQVITGVVTVLGIWLFWIV